MKTILRTKFSLLLLLITFAAQAQRWKDSLHFRRSVADRHSLRLSDSALNALGIDSILNKMEEAHYTLNHISSTNAIGFDTRSLEAQFPELDSSIDIIHENLSLYKQVLDLKNLQLFDVLLTDIQEELTQWRNSLFKYSKVLNGMSTQLIEIRRDSVMRAVMADSAFRSLYGNELTELQGKLREARDSTKANISRINSLQTELSNEYFEAIELQTQVQSLLRSAGLKSQGKEYPYMWEIHSANAQDREDRQLLRQSYHGQRRVLSYYFKRNLNDQFWMLLVGGLFLLWVYVNSRKLERFRSRGKEAEFSPRYISKWPVLPTLVVLFNMAFFFNLHPPTAYVSITEFLLVVILTALLRKRWPRQLFHYWLIISLLYLTLSFTGVLLTPKYGSRLFLLVINIASVLFGIAWLKVVRKHKLRFMSMIMLVSVIYVLLNAGAVFCNLFGRLSLAKIFSVTSIFGLTQVIGLSAFIEVILEAVQLQTIVNRLKGNIASRISFEQIQRPLRFILDLLSISVWLIVFTISLNIYDPLFAAISEFLQKPRPIGSTFFRIGNILLFFLILYVSHLLQKGVGSLYGKDSDTWDPQLRKNASRLAITRLALIVIGFLIAVAASGLPLDKITIIVGALGVGIGLGLQTIVNNFVSGIVLIFEQPFRIGDFIELNDKKGRVLDIGIRSSKLMMDEGAEIILPNADLLSGRVINWTLHNDNVRLELPLSIGPGHSFDEVSKVIKDSLSGSQSVLKNARSEVLLTAITDKSLNITVLVWIDDVHRMQSLRSVLINEIHSALTAKGILMI